MILTHQKGRGKKVHLLVDDEYTVTTDMDFWAENFIPNNTEISEKELEDLIVKINFRKAVNKCYDLLSRRDHSVKELKTKLLRTVDEISANKAIEKMLDMGYLNDEKYSHKLFDYLLNTKNYSIFQIKSEMYKKGISKDIVTDIMSENEIDQVPVICELILKKYLNKCKSEDGKRKTIAALQRRGFSYSDIKDAFYRLENDEYEL